MKKNSSQNSSFRLQPSSLPTEWQIVKFGEIAKQCKESVDRENNPFERYVEGGHMDSENLRITRWGIFGDDYVGPAFHRIFRKGQILYGSRRTYLKKVAVAEFDGITANTTFVIEPQKPEILLPGLLPFLMLSEDFTNHSVLNSKGSTNPYINWGDIAKYEFPLPPIERQKEILEVLEKLEEGISRSEVAFDSAKVLRKAIRSNFLFKGCTTKQTEKTHWGEVPKGWKIQPLSEMAQINPRYTLAKNEPIQFCEMAVVGNDSMSIEGEIETREKVSGGARFKNKDIIFARITPCAENGKITIVDFLKEDSVGVGSTEFIVISPRKTSSEYLYHLCRTNRVHGYAIKRMAGTTGRQRIPNEVFDEIMIPIPPSEEMSIIEEQLHNAENTVISIESKISRMKMLRTSFFNEVFIGGVQ